MNISIKREQNNARISSAEREKFGAKLKTKTIFKALAAAMLMPAMLLTTACSSEDNLVNNAANTENTINKGYALPVTVNVTRQGDATTRATYTDNSDGTGSLAFSAGDKLFVTGVHVGGVENHFAGLLDYDAGTGSFSGTIYTQYPISNTAQEFLELEHTSSEAYLIPEGYGKYFDLGNCYGNRYNDKISIDYVYAFAETKKLAVEQFSYEQGGYDRTNKRFVLNPYNAILNFTINGLAVSTEVEVQLSYTYTDKYSDNINVEVSHRISTDASGTATFAIGVPGYVAAKSAGTDFNNCSLTVDGKAITLGNGSSMVLTAGKIYNIMRSIVDLSTISSNYTARNGETLTGELGANVKISIAIGATVTLDGVTINGKNNGSYRWAGITCVDDATIILSGTNTVKGFYEDYPGIYVPVGNTVTIKGSGSLTASSNGWGAGIGGGWGIACGNIEIQGGTITATGGSNGAGIGGGSGASCGTITISGGTITATGGEYGAGIGSGKVASCGNITIKSTVTHVTATKGRGANSIGAAGEGSICGTVTIEDPSKVTKN